MCLCEHCTNHWKDNGVCNRRVKVLYDVKYGTAIDVSQGLYRSILSCQSFVSERKPKRPQATSALNFKARGPLTKKSFSNPAQNMALFKQSIFIPVWPTGLHSNEAVVYQDVLYIAFSPL